MAVLELKVDSSGLQGAREIAREKIASVANVRIDTTTTGRIEIQLNRGGQSANTIHTLAREGHGNKQSIPNK